jgi:hypothetical protein
VDLSVFQEHERIGSLVPGSGGHFKLVIDEVGLRRAKIEIDYGLLVKTGDQFGKAMLVAIAKG